MADDQTSNDSTAATAAGTIRAFGLASMRSILRIIPRPPTAKFFAPKPIGQPSIIEDYRSGRVAPRAAFVAMTAGASTSLFKVHETLTNAVPHTYDHAHASPTKYVHEMIGGAAGGVVYGSIMAWAPTPLNLSLSSRARSVPVHALKEATGFGLFFASHSYLMDRFSHMQQQQQQHSSSSATSTGRWDDMTLAPNVRAVFASTAAGALAGAVYHGATFPIESAKAYVAPEINVTAVRRAIQTQGWLTLYRGCVRSSLPGFFTGALTFGVYEAALQACDDVV